MVYEQNFYPEKNGTYTGDISSIIFTEIGITHIIVGDKENRAYFHDINNFINKKAISSLWNSLMAILCVN